VEQVTLRSALRQRTRRLHGRLDDVLGGPRGRVEDLPGYVRVVSSLHALHEAADRPLARWGRTSPLAASLPLSALPDRAPLYAADLAELDEPVVPPPPVDEDQVSDARGLALLYLLSGSAAGARVLLRGLPSTVPDAARRGLTDAAAPASTRLWRETCSLLAGDAIPGRLIEPTADEALAVMQWLVDRAELVAP
jgi:heme oxygenase